MHPGHPLFIISQKELFALSSVNGLGPRCLATDGLDLVLVETFLVAVLFVAFWYVSLIFLMVELAAEEILSVTVFLTVGGTVPVFAFAIFLSESISSFVVRPSAMREDTQVFVTCRIFLVKHPLMPDSGVPLQNFR